MSVPLVRKITFHPGYTTPKKLKLKRRISTSPFQPPTPFLLPIESIEEPYRIQYLMHSYSIRPIFQRIDTNAALVTFYEKNELLQPYLPIVKQTNARIEYWSFRNQFLRTTFKYLAQRWLYRRYRGRYLNTIDFVTLDEPKRVVEVYDSRAKGSYVFEAASIRRSIQDYLSFTDWLFPDPQHPKNPWTNCPFTIAQLQTIICGLYSHQLTSTFLECFKQCKWNLTEYTIRYKVPIKMEGLKHMIRDTRSEEYLELMGEFIEDEFEYHEIDFTSHLIILKWAAKQCPDDPYMAKWIAQFEQYHRVCILNGSRVLDRADDVFDRVHDATYALFLKNAEVARLGRMRLLATPRRNLRTN
jgi:hypothetical protein